MASETADSKDSKSTSILNLLSARPAKRQRVSQTQDESEREHRTDERTRTNSTSHAASSDVIPAAGPRSSSPCTVLDHDSDEETRLIMLRALKPTAPWDIVKNLDIPDEYFWNDQHPLECPCHWCGLLFPDR